ncbi:MAG: hypothetical protein GEV28_15135 [Actinophytocola sp.]|uniref:hypothetical protein n=1 Tax=Actinophytocola sp. TaxID=1872138 RepID=UPI001329D4D8|nr:hypothetical protein [Actinophytocola sp.]MPZ81655.1 hypothetical protein [Actinophytocola sp.]
MTRTALTPADPHQSALDNVVRIADLRAAGVSNHAIAARCRPSGSWQRILPGIVLLSNAPPRRRHRVRAALLYAGPEAVLTGPDAVHAHGHAVPLPEEVLVLIPSGRRLASRNYLTVERTTRLPPPVRRTGLLVAPLVRATLDAARHERDRDRLTTLLLAPVRSGACTIADLRVELNTGNQRGSAAIRALLAGREHEVVPVTHGLAKRIVRQAPLPPPRWQVQLHARDGTVLGMADAWWPEAGLAWSLGTQQHPLPTDEPTTMALTELGITVMHTNPTHLRTNPDKVIADLAAAFGYATTNPHHNRR